MRTRPYRRKLNLLEPGLALCKAIGGLFLLGVALRAFQIRIAACILFGIAGLLFLILCILLCVEQHQDRVMLALHMREDAAHGQERKESPGRM
jgi:hypothetical protein